MKTREPDEIAIKTAVGDRAVELGGRVAPQDVELVFMDGEAAPGCRVFHASWGCGRSQQWLSGLIRDNEPPDTYSGQAMAKIFQRWIETELPTAQRRAKVAAYLFDAAERHEVILSEADRIALVKHDDWLAHVVLPEAIGTAQRPGVAFWWVGPQGPSRMSVGLAERGEVNVSETFVQDMVGATRPVP